MGRRLELLALAAAVALALSAAGSPAAAQGAPELSWTRCGEGFRCAALRVPLDYDAPGGAQIRLEVIKRPAMAPSRRIGTLFFNPGGPGGAGTEDPPAFLSFFPRRVRARFDLVSWDPRGIGRSTAVQCFANAEAEARFFAGVPSSSYPVGAAEERAWLARFARYGARCARRAGDLLEHVGTADTARDLEGLRRALGDRPINYLGISYGTVLGATYANLYPDRIRAMVLDGNVDPVAWASRGVPRPALSTSLRLHGDQGAAKTLREFLDLCGEASPSACAFSAGNPAATRARFAALLERLSQGPLTLNGAPVTRAALLQSVQNALFVSQASLPLAPGWATLAQDFQALAPAGLTAAPGDRRYTSSFQGMAVQCSDSPSPPASAWPGQARFAQRRSGAIGPSWAWGDSACGGWPATAQDRYTGPWDAATSAPILVIGNGFDPSTAYRGSVRMSRLLRRARLLTVTAWGHTALLNPSACASRYEADYLISGRLPPPGAACRQDRLPFG